MIIFPQRYMIELERTSTIPCFSFQEHKHLVSSHEKSVVRTATILAPLSSLPLVQDVASSCPGSATHLPKASTGFSPLKDAEKEHNEEKRRWKKVRRESLLWTDEQLIPSLETPGQVRRAPLE